MLIVLDDNILDEINDLTIRALQNIAECAINNRHIVYASRNLFRKLSKIKQLDSYNKRIFKKLASKITQYGAIKKNFNTYIRVMSNNDKILLSSTTKNIYDVPIKFLSDSANLQKTKLICEDLSDCKFYASLTKFIMNQKNLSWELGFENINGGGINISETYLENLESNSSPCLVIADSDKVNECSNLGKTALELENIHEKYFREHVTTMHILNVRERENLIPPYIYYYLETESSQKKHYSILVDIFNQSKETYLYGDIKSGLKIDDVQVKKYIRNQLNDLLTEDFTVEDLINLTASIPKYLRGTTLAAVLEEFCTSTQSNPKQRLLSGVRNTFTKFHKKILNNEIQSDINQKKELIKNLENSSETLEKEIYELEETEVKILDIINNLSPEFQQYWNEIAELCYQWGAKIPISVV